MTGHLSVLSEAGLGHIAAHQYKPGKYTPLDLLLNPYWAQLAEVLPKWLAPNLVTLLGWFPLAFTYALAWSASPSFDAAPPRWLAFTTTATLYFYQTMDAVDGKQARRTGSSSPLGQLFDHGCDCLTCISQHSAGAMVLIPGPSLWTLVGMAALQTGFFMAQWQEYHTGVLRTSFGPVGVTETQFALMVLALCAALAGPEAVQAFFSSQVQLPWHSAPLSTGTLFIQGWSVFCAVLMAMCLGKTLSHVLEEKGTAGLLPALRDLLPMVAVNVLLVLWPSNFIAHAPRELCLLTGLLFFYMTAQMILFSMARMYFPAGQLALLPYAALVLLSRLAPEALAYKGLVAVTAAFGCWVLLWLGTVIDELKEKLGIYAFSLSKKGAAEESKSK